MSVVIERVTVKWGGYLEVRYHVGVAQTPGCIRGNIASFPASVRDALYLLDEAVQQKLRDEKAIPVGEYMSPTLMRLRPPQETENLVVNAVVLYGVYVRDGGKEVRYSWDTYLTEFTPLVDALDAAITAHLKESIVADGGEPAPTPDPEPTPEPDPTPEPTWEHELVIYGPGSGLSTTYAVTVTGSIEHFADASRGITIDADESVSGLTAVGSVGGGIDGVRYTGEIVAFGATGDEGWRVELDGVAVDPATLGV